jgi:HlyD family secretion protein
VTGRKQPYAALLLAAAVLSAAAVCLSPKDDGVLTATGLVEITQADLTAKVGGYLVKREFSEGTPVRGGQIIAFLDDEDYRLTYLAAREAYESARAHLADLEAGPRAAELEALSAARRTAERSLAKAELDYQRFSELYERGAVSAQTLDNYRLALTNNQGAYEQAEAAHRLGLEGSRADAVRAQRHAVERLSYAMRLAETSWEHTKVKAPVSGRVLSKNYEVGEYIQQGAPIATIGDLSDCWVKIYIPSTFLGKVRLDQEAEVRIDAYPGRVFAGRVREIAGQAEFTPRQTITKDERANLVFALKVALENGEGIFKPGMPAEVRLP